MPRKQSRAKVTDLVGHRRIRNRSHGSLGGGGAVRIAPCVLDFRMHFGNGHLQRGVRHLEWRKIEPMRGTSEPPLFGEPCVKRSRWKRCDLSEYGQSRGPLTNLAQGAFGNAGRIVIEAKA